MVLQDSSEEFSSWNSIYKPDDRPYKWGSMVETPQLIHIFNDRKIHRILDLACGDGGQMVSFLDQFMVVGVDQSRAAINQAKKNLIANNKRNFALICSEIRSNKLADESFGAVILKDVFMQFRDPDEILRQSVCKLDRGGILVLSTFSNEDLEQYKKYAATKIISRREILYDKVYYTRFYSEEELASLVTSHGLNILSLKKNTYPDMPHENFRNECHQHTRIVIIAEKNI